MASSTMMKVAKMEMMISGRMRMYSAPEGRKLPLLGMGCLLSGRGFHLLFDAAFGVR